MRGNHLSTLPNYVSTRLLFAYLALGSMTSCSAAAQGFPGLDPVANLVGQVMGVNVDVAAGSITFGPPQPQKLPSLMQQLPQNTAQFFLNPLGGALASSIRQARDNVRQNCGPAPPNVVADIRQFMPPDIFNGVCWAIIRDGSSLDSLLIHDGGMQAVTLEDTIVFADSKSGFDSTLWAHELIHVLQYRRLGVDAFANLYIGSWPVMEGEAYQFQGFVQSALQNRTPAQYQTQSGWDPKHSNNCWPICPASKTCHQSLHLLGNNTAHSPDNWDIQ